MITDEIKTYKKALILQGPRGIFFTRFGYYLRKQGIKVYKINLNGGDMIFYPCPDAYSFRKSFEEWGGFLQDFLDQKEIDCVFLFGDCRKYHQVAIKIAHGLGISVFVFEEGYIRPDYITLEKYGVNGHSHIPCNPEFYLSLPKYEEENAVPAQTSFLHAALSAFIYHFFELLMRWRYPYYRYHKEFSYLKEPFLWMKSGIRKIIYRMKQRKLEVQLAGPLRNKYFLVPLQVFNDSQVVFHSKYKSSDDFIAEIIRSFAGSASKEHFLVFKHHPMDRGHTNYDRTIQFYANKHNLSERVKYVHDLHLPSLLKNSLGSVLINSTVGLSSLYHGTPVKVMGTAIYDMPGLTYQGNIDDFWQNPGNVNSKLYNRFRRFIINNTQINGSFYGLWPFNDDSKSKIP